MRPLRTTYKYELAVWDEKFGEYYPDERAEQAERDAALGAKVRARLSTHDAKSIRWLASEALGEKRPWLALLFGAIADALDVEQSVTNPVTERDSGKGCAAANLADGAKER